MRRTYRPRRRRPYASAIPGSLIASDGERRAITDRDGPSLLSQAALDAREDGAARSASALIASGQADVATVDQFARLAQHLLADGSEVEARILGDLPVQRQARDGRPPQPSLASSESLRANFCGWLSAGRERPPRRRKDAVMGDGRREFDVSVGRWRLGEVMAERVPGAAMRALAAGCDPPSLGQLAAMDGAGWSRPAVIGNDEGAVPGGRTSTAPIAHEPEFHSL